METIGDRLRVERLRLAITQEEMAKAGGVARSAQANYEKGERHPDSQYLTSIHSVGVDIYYVLTGLRKILNSDVVDDSRSDLISKIGKLKDADFALVESLIIRLAQEE